MHGGTQDDSEGKSPDGRAGRRSRNVDAALDAFVELIEEGPETPTFEQVAVRAGLSASSIYRYFDHIDEMSERLVERGRERLQQALAAEVGDEVMGLSLDDRIDRYFAERAEFKRLTGNRTDRSVSKLVDQPRTAEMIAEVRNAVRDRIWQFFQPELDAHPEHERPVRVTAIYVAGSLPTRSYLMDMRNRSSDEVDEYVRWQIHAALNYQYLSGAPPVSG